MDHSTLQIRFQRAYPKPKWALTASERVRYKDNLDANSENAGDSDASMEAESEEEHPIMNLLQQSTSLLSKATKRLPPGFLEITRVKDANHQAYSKLSIQSVDFHPNSQVLLAAGPDKTLRLFQAGSICPT
jgi:U3 small nucleolar RNA-associated protein 18